MLGELITWNLGNAGVIAGTVLELAAITDVGGMLLVAALALFLGQSRGSPSSWMLNVYRLLIVIVLVSIPVGLLLQQVRAH